MKISRILLALAATALLSAVPAAAWGKYGHAAVAKIAEDHLTETARRTVRGYLGGESIVTYASYPDQYRGELDKTFRPDWYQGVKYPHTFTVDRNNRPYEDQFHEGDTVANCLWLIRNCQRDLARAEALDPQTRLIEIAFIVHLIGDMHAVGHVRYPGKQYRSNLNVNFLGEEMSYHKVWDSGLITDIYPYGFVDLAYLCDTASEEEIAAFCEGDVYDWGYSCAVSCYEARHSVHEGDKLTRKWTLSYIPLARHQIRAAGYRLAHVLNTLFDPAYK